MLHQLLTFILTKLMIIINNLLKDLLIITMMCSLKERENFLCLKEAYIHNRWHGNWVKWKEKLIFSCDIIIIRNSVISLLLVCKSPLQNLFVIYQSATANSMFYSFCTHILSLSPHLFKAHLHDENSTI